MAKNYAIFKKKNTLYKCIQGDTILMQVFRTGEFGQKKWEYNAAAGAASTNPYSSSIKQENYEQNIFAGNNWGAAEGTQHVAGGASVNKTGTSNPVKAAGGAENPAEFDWRQLEKVERELRPVCDAQHQWDA